MGTRNFFCDSYRVREPGEFTPNQKWSGNQPNPKISDALDSISRTDSESGTPSDSRVPGSPKKLEYDKFHAQKKHRTREGVCTPQITGMVFCAREKSKSKSQEMESPRIFKNWIARHGISKEKEIIPRRKSSPEEQ